MAINPKLLNEGESVVLSTRTHPKVLLVPLIALVVILAVAVFLNTLGSGDAAGIMHLVVWILVALAIFWFVVRPVVRWATTTYTFTNRRFMKRSGFIAKEGRTIPLNRISGVDFEIGGTHRAAGHLLPALELVPATWPQPQRHLARLGADFVETVAVDHRPAPRGQRRVCKRCALCLCARTFSVPQATP